jgi:hypothetical protein
MAFRPSTSKIQTLPRACQISVSGECFFALLYNHYEVCVLCRLSIPGQAGLLILYINFYIFRV